MTPKEFEAAALALPGAELSLQWKRWRLFKVGGKEFAFMSESDRPTVSFKVSDIAFEMLTKEEGIKPDRYRARVNFVQLESLDAMDDREIRERLKEAHRLVVEQLPKRRRPIPG